MLTDYLIPAMYHMSAVDDATSTGGRGIRPILRLYGAPVFG